MFKSKPLIYAAGGCLGVLCLMVVSCAGLLYWGYTSVGKTVSPRVDALFLAIEEGSFSETYDTETAQGLRARATREQYAALGETLRFRLGPLESKWLESFNMQQKNADSTLEATYKATFEKGTGTIFAKMVKEDGDWKFLTFHVNSPLFDSDLSTTACSLCGASHAIEDRFCPACGVDLLPPDEDEQPSELELDEPAEPAPSE
ncbi:hypothetical protein MalM25_09070 [Planctomycetes bacterium MalM25]|nr:hypothetical protein MalM25_09070 [Planctomycetes bacterium MalM25]